MSRGEISIFVVVGVVALLVSWTVVISLLRLMVLSRKLSAIAIEHIMSFTL